MLDIRHIYNLMYSAYGPQHWWPARTPFEVMIGAVLTQNTAWRNVEHAIANLNEAGVMDAEAIAALSREALAMLIRPAGYFNVKARRLQSMCYFFLAQEKFEGLGNRPAKELRKLLLNVHGIGPETADSILLYALNRPVFVVDAYTRRIFQRLGAVAPDAGYDQVQAFFHDRLPHDVELFNEYHALIVEHAKRNCRVKPICTACSLLTLCPAGKSRFG